MRDGEFTAEEIDFLIDVGQAMKDEELGRPTPKAVAFTARLVSLNIRKDRSAGALLDVPERQVKEVFSLSQEYEDSRFGVLVMPTNSEAWKAVKRAMAELEG